MIGTQVRQGKENVAIPGKTDALRYDADDFARNAIDIQTLAERERQRAETISPEPLANQRDFGCAGLIIFRDEIAPEPRRDLQDR